MNAQAAIDLRGIWINQNGSELQVDEQTGHGFIGSFRSRRGRAAAGVDYPVRGIVHGELLSFGVAFATDAQDLAAISTFSGRYARAADGVERLHTLWILARAYEDEARTKPTHVWNTFITNADVFERRRERP